MSIDVLLDEWNLDQTEIELVDIDDESDIDWEDEEDEREDERENEEIKPEGDESCYMSTLSTIGILSRKTLHHHLNVWISPGLETFTPPPENTIC